MSKGCWVVSVKGKADHPFEIALVREGYELGLRSCGYFERDRKLPIADMSGYNHWSPTSLGSVTPAIFARLAAVGLLFA